MKNRDGRPRRLEAQPGRMLIMKKDSNQAQPTVLSRAPWEFYLLNTGRPAWANGHPVEFMSEL